MQLVKMGYKLEMLMMIWEKLKEIKKLNKIDTN